MSCPPRSLLDQSVLAPTRCESVVSGSSNLELPVGGGDQKMTIAEETTRSGAELVDELRAWLEENWDLDLTLGEWWERLGMAGWAAPMLPADCYGRGLSRGDSLQVSSTIAKFGAMSAPMGMSIGLASPTIAA